MSKSGKYPLGAQVAEGKTKRIHEIKGDPYLANLKFKDDITAGDGKMHDVIAGKGVLANRMTCNVFRFLKAHGIPVAFEEQNDPDSFIAPRCDMLPYEVVIRGEADGSYLKRNPDVQKWHVFEEPIVEFYLKTKGRRWKTHELPCDDPLMVLSSGKIDLYEPGKPLQEGPFLTLEEGEVFRHEYEFLLFDRMVEIARRGYLLLRDAYAWLGYRYIDYKVEFGFDCNGKLLLSDTIDNDSGRLVDREGKYVDKQYYRNGGTLENTKRLYELVADLTDRFELPEHQNSS